MADDSEPDHLAARIDAVTKLLSSLEPLHSGLSSQPREYFMDTLDLVCRGSYVRQHEALKGHVAATKEGSGHATVLVLRPALEELLWLEYLATIEADLARRLLTLMAIAEAGRAVRAQQQHLGKKTMRRVGFPAGFVKQSDRNLRGAERELLELAERLGFADDSGDETRRWLGPSMGELAELSGQQTLYQFLYSATSRTVHFSPAELMRRSWFGGDLKTSISSSNFERYWADFGLAWGAELLVLTARAAVELLPSEIDIELTDEVLDAIDDVMSLGKVPIVTPEEMNVSLE